MNFSTITSRITKSQIFTLKTIRSLEISVPSFTLKQISSMTMLTLMISLPRTSTGDSALARVSRAAVLLVKPKVRSDATGSMLIGSETLKPSRRSKTSNSMDKLTIRLTPHMVGLPNTQMASKSTTLTIISLLLLPMVKESTSSQTQLELPEPL